MEPDGGSSPIWSNPSNLYVPVRRRRRLSSVLIPMTLTISISVLLIFIVFLLLPPPLSRNNQVHKPNSSVKKSWNSINIFLVLFAVLCGVFARRNDETASSDGAEIVPNAYEFVTSGRRSVSGADLLDSPDRKAYDEMSDYMDSGGKRLRSSSSSSHDLRHESLWGSDVEMFKYTDEFELDFHHFHRHVRHNHEVEKDVVAEIPVREIPVDKFELKNSVPPSPTQPISQVPQPPPPPPPPVKRRRSVHSVPKQHNVDKGGREAEFKGKKSSLPSPTKTPPPTLPAPAPELKFHPLAERREKSRRKNGGTTKEIATAIVSTLYEGTQRKRNKKVRSRYIFESVAQNSSPPTELVPSSIPSVPPPPPPPPPPKKVLQNFFKKSSKSKRVHSVSTANPLPPPPPPPPSIFNNIFKTGSKNKRFPSTSASSQLSPPPPPSPPPPSVIYNSLFNDGTKSQGLKYIDPHPLPRPPPTPPRNHPNHSPASTGKPPKPSTPHHDSVVVAPASPLIPMPPPPPPPPFTVPEMKFIAKGDFVRIRSLNSSSGLEDFDVMSVKSDGGDAIGPSFTCPSPDVDLKADSFISKRRDEWRLEKINSLKEQQRTGSSSARLRL